MRIFNFSYTSIKLLFNLLLIMYRSNNNYSVHKHKILSIPKQQFIKDNNILEDINILLKKILENWKNKVENAAKDGYDNVIVYKYNRQTKFNDRLVAEEFFINTLVGAIKT